MRGAPCLRSSAGSAGGGVQLLDIKSREWASAPVWRPPATPVTLSLDGVSSLLRHSVVPTRSLTSEGQPNAV